MIGYMKPFFDNRPDKKEMKNAYRMVYCSLCRCLRSEYGIPGIIAVNYELVFLVLLSLALQEDKPNEEWHSCSIMPYFFVKTVNYASPVFRKAAGLSILTVWGELDDNFKDERRFCDKALLWLYNHPKQKAASLWPDLYQGFSKRLMQYYLLEDIRADFSDIVSAYDFF